MATPSHYEILGIAPAASQEEIKKRYRDLARQFHPDVAPTNETDDRFRSINEAYRVLSDVEQRTFYDAELTLAAARRAAEAARQRPKSPAEPAGRRPSTTREQRPSSWQSSGKGSKRPAPNAAPEERKSPVEVYLAQARAAIRTLRYREAESLCRQALRLDRRNQSAYEILGDIHRARGNQDEAIAMYSYALQLDRNNAALREKFDKLVGQPTGPTMSGRAASSYRSRSAGSRSQGSPVEKRLAATLAVINGIGGVLVACMLALVAMSEVKLAETPIYIGWEAPLLMALASSGWMCGFVLAVNRRIDRFFDELTGIKYGTRTNIGLPVGAITVIVSVISLYAGFLIYAALGTLQKFHSTSVLCAFGFCAAIVVFFTMVAQGAGIYVLISGGSVVFLGFLMGWLIGDVFR